MILNRLRETNSTIEKQVILKDASPYEKKIFQYAYDLKKRYYLKFEAINYDTVGYSKNNEILFDLLDNLYKRELTGDAARVCVMSYATHYGDLIKLICNKDLDCGITATTLNKVFGKDFISQFKLQGAVKLPWDKIPVPTIGQIKYNGARMVILFRDGEVIFKSRGGHEFEFPKLLEVIKASGKYHSNEVLEGELAYGDSQWSNHTKVSGLVNSAIKGTPIVSDALVFTAFDCMTLEDFENQKCSMSYKERLREAQVRVNIFNSPMIDLAESFYFNTIKEIQTKFDELLANGYEGLILKQPTSLYTFRKNKNWIKLKNEDTADLLCVDIVSGKDSYEGGVGSLVCEGIVEGKQVKVNVSSGLTLAQRFLHPNGYVGKHIETSYNEVIQDSKTGLWSLFIPRFIIVREDKI